MVHDRALGAEDQGVSTGTPSQPDPSGGSDDGPPIQRAESESESTCPAPASDSGVVLLAEEEIEAANRVYEARWRAQQHQDSPTAHRVGSVISKPSTAQKLETNVTATLNTPGTGDDRPEAEATGASSATEGHYEDGEHILPDDVQEPAVLKGVVEWVMVLVGAVAVALVFRAFLFQAFWIPSESMEGTLEVNDRVMVNRLSYRLHDVNRGDIIVFHKPEGLASNVDELIKRVMALEGETIEGRNGAVYVDGQRVAESYLDPADTIFDFGPTLVPPGHVFVMGDNRDDSTDSRVFGPIEVQSIVGRAFVIFWPMDRLEAL